MEQTEKIVYSRGELAIAMGVSRWKVDRLIREKGFPVIRLGKRVMIPKDKFKDWMDKQGSKGA